MTKASAQAESRRDILRFSAASAVSVLVAACGSDTSTPSTGGGQGGNHPSGTGGSGPAPGTGGSGPAPGTGGSGPGPTTGGSGPGPATGGSGPAAGGGGPTGPTGPVSGWKEDNAKGVCMVGTPPASVSNAKLPDPFKFISGKRLSSKADWECLRADLSAMLQQSIYGA